MLASVPGGIRAALSHLSYLATHLVLSGLTGALLAVGNNVTGVVLVSMSGSQE